MTQPQLASMLGVNARTVRRWELGEVRIKKSVEMVLKDKVAAARAAARG